VQLLRLFFPAILLFIAFLCGYGKGILWSDSTEAQLLQSMLMQAHKGKWFPMTNKTMPFDEFMLKGGRLYRETEDVAFTGWYAQFDHLDEPRMLSAFVDGQKNGFTYLWDENGTRRFQGEYLNNLKNGLFLEWNINAIQTSEKNYRLNKLNGDYHLWYDSGKIKLDAIFEDGKLQEARGWYPDGSPCPFSRVVNGRGLILRYQNNYKPTKQPEVRRGILANTLDQLGSFEPEITEKGNRAINLDYESGQSHQDRQKTD
jgi:antitoxin component YwqK of YwqJK toxin-antitoxin module